MHLLHPVVPAVNEAGAPPFDPAFDPAAAAGKLAQSLLETAVERDRAGGHAGPERELIRESGLLALSVPRIHGGLGADWATVLRTVRIVARADSALAHLLGFHHLQLAGLQLYGNADQQRRLLRTSIDDTVFWGNALNPLDKRLVATPTAGGYLLKGIKGFASGSVGSDWLTISAWDPLANGALIAVLPTRQPGIEVQADWDAFGQRQTDSGNVRFDGVLCPTTWCCSGPARRPRHAARCARRWRS
jgi:alkylation response protein AidB-like acyl-CoA dehydrogenase